MTVDMPDIDDVLRTNGYRATPQRRTIYTALMMKKYDHPTVAEIHQIAEREDPTISLATVYKALQLFTKIGLINEMGFRDESTRYDGSVEPHIHLICNKCGKVEDYDGFKLDTVAPDLKRSLNFEVLTHRFEVHGLCADCQRKS